VYSSVDARVCLRHRHHFASCHHIISHNITSISYRINGTKIGYEAKLRQILCQNENVLRHEVNFGKYNFIRLAIEGASFFTKHEKKGGCFFAEGSKTVCVQISRIVKKYITVIYMSH
jgi:hypothetical protein